MNLSSGTKAASLKRQRLGAVNPFRFLINYDLELVKKELYFMENLSQPKELTRDAFYHYACFWDNKICSKVNLKGYENVLIEKPEAMSGK